MPTQPRASIPTNWATTNSRSIRGLHHEIVVVLPDVEATFRQYTGNPKYRITITGGQEFGHSLFSRHHTGFAVDLRTKDLPQGVATQILGTVQKKLGPNYFAQLESKPAHLHIEYKPGYKVSNPLDYEQLTGSTKDLA